MMNDVDAFLEHYGVKGMRWQSKAPDYLTRVARVAAGTDSRKKNIQEAIKAKIKKIADAMKEEEKKRKKEEDALKELDEAGKEEEDKDDDLSAFIKKHGDSTLKEFLSEETFATSNE